MTNLITIVTCIVLHPRIKMAYYKKHGWEDEWVKEMEDAVKSVYETYALAHQRDHPPVTTNEQDSPNITNDSRMAYDDDDLDAHVFGESAKDTNELTQLDLYIQEPVNIRAIDPLKWWSLMGSSYPICAAMARDFLAVPGTFLNHTLHW